MKKFVFLLSLLFIISCKNDDKQLEAIKAETMAVTREAFVLGWKQGYNACKNDKGMEQLIVDSLIFGNYRRLDRPKTHPIN